MLVVIEFPAPAHYKTFYSILFLRQYSSNAQNSPVVGENTICICLNFPAVNYAFNFWNLFNVFRPLNTFCLLHRVHRILQSPVTKDKTMIISCKTKK